MQAIVQSAYGPPDVLHLMEVATPEPADNEVRIKMVATTVTSADVRLRAFDVPAMFWLPARLVMGITRPRKPILGVEFAGTIDAVGKDVTRFKLGDAVFGQHVYGCYAQYKCVPETGAIALKPAAIDFAEAAGVPFGGLTALHFLRKAGIAAGQSVLIYGASGAVGTAAVQLAKHFGATVTAVASAANGDLLRSLGADVVIDYAATDCTQGSARYDIVMDTVGKLSFARARAVMQPVSRYVPLVMQPADIMHMLRSALPGGQKVVAGTSGDSQADLDYLAGLIAAGQYRPVIDRHYRFDEIQAAHAYVDTGRKKGAVVVLI